MSARIPSVYYTNKTFVEKRMEEGKDEEKDDGKIDYVKQLAYLFQPPRKQQRIVNGSVNLNLNLSFQSPIRASSPSTNPRDRTYFRGDDVIIIPFEKKICRKNGKFYNITFLSNQLKKRENVGTIRPGSKPKITRCTISKWDKYK